ncbi:TonB-dependent receptor [Methylomagnum ishizawai]|uniref:TonB-dependent receptor n=1 Tax=Methylomagnum ishizawai TaxID=1760988 RepID=UPI001C3432D7|nr:TonB-dependent receptor [Methylomagnum ishizawai]BBL73943.1 hypothetical protein MishRS11D_10410 [Methylomagnum ishizawai]
MTARFRTAGLLNLLVFAGLAVGIQPIESAWGDTLNDEAHPLPEVTVYDTAPDQSKNITVIDRKAIENAPGNSLIDLLSREANVNLRSSTGNDKFGGVDIRGMGDSYSSNVLVLVDGVKLNAPDLSGVDFTTLSLEQIERVEIIRGGNGVMYGDGAVGGVINIVTRRGQQTKADLYGNYGSFDTLDSSLNASLKSGSTRASLNAFHNQTHGYRDNSFLDKTQVAANLAHPLTQALEFQAGFRFHEDRYGLPGPVDYSAINNAQLRRAASTPDGGGKTRDYLGQAGGSMDWGPVGSTVLKWSYRYRDNPYEAANYWSEGENAVAPWKNTFKFQEVDIRHQLSFNSGPITQDWTLGYFGRFGSAGRQENGQDIPDQSVQKDAQYANQSGFINTRWNLPIPWVLDAGYRYDRFAVQRQSVALKRVCTYAPVFPYQPLGCENRWLALGDSDNTWHNFAADIGLTWNMAEYLSWYFNYNHSYRNPNAEELVLSAQDLHPQSGNNFETGWRLRSQNGGRLSLALFRMRNEQEIYYDNHVNRNYADATLRQGLELSGRLMPMDTLSLSGNFGFIDARFETTGLKVPLVPELSGQVSLLWQATTQLSLSVSAEFIGPRSNGANIASGVDAPKLAAYQRVDLKAFYKLGDAEFFAGINNLFDDFYETTAYGLSFYPMPTRQFYAGLTYTFPAPGEQP